MEEVKRLVCADEKMVLSKEALGILVSNTFVSYNGVVYKTPSVTSKALLSFLLYLTPCESCAKASVKRGSKGTVGGGFTRVF